MMSDYLFAYGTLQPDCAPPEMKDVIARLSRIGEGFVRGMLYDLGRFPGAVADASAANRIAGVVLELPEEPGVLAQLDAYEEFDSRSSMASEFVRERQNVELAAGGTLECWFYRYNGKLDAARVVESGIWRKDSGR